MDFIKVESIRTTNTDGTLLKDKNGNAMRVVVFAPFYGENIGTNKREQCSRTLFDQDGVSALIAGKTMLRGSIVRFETSAPYEWTDKDGVARIAHSKTVVVLNGESAVAVANNALRDNGVTVIDGDVITTYIPSVKKVVGAGQDLKKK